MSQVAQEKPKLSAIQHLQIQLANFIRQRDQVMANFEQVKGAIYACEEMIKKLEAEAKDNLGALASSTGDSKDGEASDQSAEQAAQE